jgi:tRNA(Ile2) C34 agmatinyltransferase TiaS
MAKKAKQSYVTQEHIAKRDAAIKRPLIASILMFIGSVVITIVLKFFKMLEIRGLMDIFGVRGPCPECGENAWLDTHHGIRCSKCNYREDWK